jgi:Protein of unknown function with HXXEE motif
MNPELRSILSGTAGLIALLGIAAVVAIARPQLSPDRRARARFALLALVAVATQALHFAEELGTQFYERFPSFLGLAPWSRSFFVIFNVSWLVLWAVSAFGVRAGFVLAAWPIWFLGLALLLNGIVHPLLGFRVGGYFPGLITAPITGLVGLVLLVQLSRLTRGQLRAV